jgi:hypothetical protein
VDPKLVIKSVGRTDTVGDDGGTTSTIEFATDGGYEGTADVYYATVAKGAGPPRYYDYTHQSGASFPSGKTACSIVIPIKSTNGVPTETDVYLLLVKDGKMSNLCDFLYENWVRYDFYGFVVKGAKEKPSIKEKFGIETQGPDGVTETFKMLDYFIQIGGLTDRPDVINLGDYINLGTLPNIGGSNVNFPRVIVVGINSFHSGNGVDGEYAVTANDRVDHVVFQFANLLPVRVMNSSASNTNGYGESAMRDFLTETLLPVVVDSRKGGVPKDLMWAPLRHVSGNPSTVQDLLWLPTEWEMCGAQSNSDSYETQTNQARLEYYTDNTSRIKGTAKYWLGSRSKDGDANFCVIDTNGTSSTASASESIGSAPAFCIGYDPAP